MASILRVGDRWRALVRRRGHQPYCKTFRAKAQAEAWACQIETDIDRGISPSPGSMLRLLEPFGYIPRRFGRAVRDWVFERS